jgi:hypothetical protein
MPLWLVGTAVGQEATGPRDSVRVVAGAQYRSPPLPRYLVGSTYRDLWLDTIHVEVLDLRRTAGGLTPLRRGGGRQTASLRFLDAAGREYTFRSVDKSPTRAQEVELRGTLGGQVLRDQVSSLVPAAPVLAARMATAADVLHAPPRLVVMPDDPVLGEFRDEFAGMLGTFEEHSDEIDDDTPGFGGFEQIAATESLLATMREDPRHQVDARAYLNARLLDLLLGDWDRHADQWRWARVVNGAGFLWKPIARDRDYVLSDYDGALMIAVRLAIPNTVRFRDEYVDLNGLLDSARELDTQLLAPLDRAVWDSTAVALRARITDQDIAEAVNTLPMPFVESRGAAFVAALRSRRDRLELVADEFYRRLASVAQVHASDGDELARIERRTDGSVSVRIASSFEDWQGVTFDREFNPDETKEIRIFLMNGDDRAVLTGAGERGIVIRVIGGDGADVLVDSSFVARRGAWTSFHDDGPDDRLLGRSTTTIDRRQYSPPVAEGGDDAEAEAAAEEEEALPWIPLDDSGTTYSILPILDYSTTRGVIFGAGVSLTDGRFRHDPYGARISLDLRFAPRWSAFALSGNSDFHFADPATRLEIDARVSQIDAFRFYGFGNETDDPLPAEHYLVRPRVVAATATFYRRLGDELEIGVGGIARHTRYPAGAAGPLSQLESAADPLGMLGLKATARIEGINSTKRTQIEADLTATFIPLTTQGEGSFGTIQGAIGAILPLSSTGATRAHLRFGGRYAFGDYPVDEAAYLGGRHSLRGYPEWRFAGDAMTHATVEGITRLGRVPLLVNWNVDGVLFGDVGRVFLSGESSDRWHGAPGAGLTFSLTEVTLGATVAYGPEPRLYLDADVDF